VNETAKAEKVIRILAEVEVKDNKDEIIFVGKKKKGSATITPRIKRATVGRAYSMNTT
jgi:hypothetical protein